MSTKQKILLFIESICVTFALQVSSITPLPNNTYKSGFHYLYAQITHILGEYDIKTLFLLCMVLFFLYKIKESIRPNLKQPFLLAAFLGFCLLIGQSYRTLGNWNACFGSPYTFLAFILSWIGYTIFFVHIIPGIFHLLLFLSQNNKDCFVFRILFRKHCGRNVFFLILLAWLPILILSYPGNLCYDCLGQIEQGLGIAPYSAHHPLFHTLLISTIIKLGKAITGSYNIGLFFYVLLQASALAFALSQTVVRLVKRNISPILCACVTFVYLFTPMYSNIVSTAVKDVPFMAAFIWYILLLEKGYHDGFENKDKKYYLNIILVEILTALLRNNGIYVIVLTGFFMTVYLIRKASLKTVLIVLLCLSLLPFAGYKLGNETMIHALSAERGSKGEIFSLPFQQTARYLQLYRDTLTLDEQRAIEAVLMDVNEVAARYHPNIADPVKALYKTDATSSELTNYFKTWVCQFFKHPSVYFQAFFVHVYGWFDPGTTNAIRYEATSEIFSQSGLFPGADKLLIYLYRFVEYIPFLAIWENVGFYTWLLLLLLFYCRTRKNQKGILLSPLLISLLICMVSPCFYLHPRYAFPIMFTIPFLLTCIIGEKREE